MRKSVFLSHPKRMNSHVCNLLQVACRDYPHPRHLCAKFPFSSTQHESRCDMVRHFFVFLSKLFALQCHIAEFDFTLMECSAIVMFATHLLHVPFGALESHVMITVMPAIKKNAGSLQEKDPSSWKIPCLLPCQFPSLVLVLCFIFRNCNQFPQDLINLWGQHLPVGCPQRLASQILLGVKGQVLLYRQIDSTHILFLGNFSGVVIVILKSMAVEV